MGKRNVVNHGNGEEGMWGGTTDYADYTDWGIGGGMWLTTEGHGRGRREDVGRRF
ncbi:MAG: hypothetical protein JXJ04_19120 [Spirochaetales bacterium]|nr:hypothetical protein [Spirochaetales bacterium]